MSATGHAKNVANFEHVIIILSGLGAIYNPTQAFIMLAALNSKLAAAQAALAAVDTKEAENKIAVNERQAEFDDIGDLVQDVKRAAEISVNDAAFTKDLTAITRKFHGGRAGKKPVDDPLTPDVDESKNTISVSERTYDNMVAFFADLIALVETQASYASNEPHVKLPALNAKLAAMQTKNNNAKAALAALGSAQDARDAVLYDPETGVIKLVQLVKKYVALILGKKSKPYQQINALQFKKN